MAITGARRLTVVQQVSRNANFRGRALAIEVSGRRGFDVRAVEVIKNLPVFLATRGVEVKFYTPLGLELDATGLVGKNAEQIDEMAAEVDKLSQVAVARQPVIEIPEMIAISDKLSIMKEEVTVGLFKQVMEGYEITGHNAEDLQNAEELQAILNNPSQAENALTYVSLVDTREFAKRLSDLTGRKFRVQTEKEWLAARRQLLGSNLTWTETQHPEYWGYEDNFFILRRLSDEGASVLRRLYDYYRHVLGRADFRCSIDAARLVEDK